MKKLLPSERPEKEVANRGGHALICRHDENQKHSWFWDGRTFQPAAEPNLNVSRPISSVSSHPTTATLRERLRAKRWTDEIDTETTKKSKFEVPGPPPSPPPPPSLPPPNQPKKNSNAPVVEGYVDLPRYIPRPLDGGYGYVIVASSFSGNVLVGGTIYSFSPFLNVFSNYYTASIGHVSWISSAMIGSFYWTGIFATSLTNKYGYRTVCLGGTFVASGAYVVTIFASSTAYLVGLQGFIAGFGLGCIFTPSTLSVGNYFEEKRATASGLSRAGTGLGTMVFPPLANLFIKNLGWQGANLIIALVIFVVGMIMTFLLQPVEVPKMKKQYLYDGVAEVTKSFEDDDERYEIAGKYLNSSAPSTASDSTANDKNMFKKFIESFTKTRTGSSEQIFENNELQRFRTKMSSRDYSGQIGTENIYYLKHNENDEEALKGLKVVPTTTTTDGISWFCCPRAKGEKYITVPPLAREDVFYTGNIRSLREFHQQEQFMPKYRWMTNFISNITKVMSSIVFGKTQPSNSGSGWCQSFKEIVKLKLLENPVILLLVAATFVGTLGAYIPFTFFRAAAMAKGIDSYWATFLISIMGVPNLIESVVAGLVAYFFKNANSFALWINNISLLLAGLCMVLTPLAESFVDFAVIALFYGIFIFIYFTLTTILLVELHVLKDLTAAFKLLLLFKGSAATLGTPIAGYIYDSTHNYDGSFYFCGSVLFLSALLHSLVPLVSGYCLHKATLFESRNDEDEPVQQKREIWQKGFKILIEPDAGKVKNQSKSQTGPSNKRNENNFFHDESNDWKLQDLENAEEYDDKRKILPTESKEETRFDSPERNDLY